MYPMDSIQQSQNVEDLTNKGQVLVNGAAFSIARTLSQIISYLCQKSKSKLKRDQCLLRIKPDFKLVLIKISQQTRNAREGTSLL